MMQRRKLLKCVLMAAVLAAPLNLAAQNKATDSPLKSPDKKTIAGLDKEISESLRDATVPGMSIALIRDGKTYWVHGFGVKDVKTKQPVTEETTFEAASLSKPVFAYGVLKLVDAGKLDLDAPLTKYLPQRYIEGDDRLDKITARIVMSHRTGFRNWRGDGSNPLKIYFTPGEKFSYSGEGFVYLQKVVEQITGKKLNEYMSEAVFVPLGMASSSYIWTKEYDARSATGHDADGQPEEKWKPQEANAASSLQTTAADYARFVEAVLNGNGLKPATLQELEKPHIAVDPACTNCTDRVPGQLSKELFWGLGWGIQETKDGESLWHWGDNGSFKAYVVAYPKQKIGLVMFLNGQNGLAIRDKMVRMALGGEQPAFAWAKYDQYDSAAMQFARAVRDKGATVAIEEFHPALVDGSISEESINSQGYRVFYGMKKPAEALRIFQLNVELHPNSWNAYDSLGEIYAKNGQKELAIENYQKSLDLNPKNDGAVKMLAELRKK
jgi:CubicO group peptidase (beta-lactamase class C family)